MTQEIPKYCALCVDNEESIGYCGIGDTPDEAFNHFVLGDSFREQCEDWIMAPGDDVRVYIYTCIEVNDSEWPEEERNPDWEWCLGKKIDTRIVEAV